MALVGACMLTNPFYCTNCCVLLVPDDYYWNGIVFFKPLSSCCFKRFTVSERKRIWRIFIFTVHMWTLRTSHVTVAKDNLPSLGSFLRKRYCTERRKDEASLWMNLELPALLSECKATTMPVATNESYLPLSMNYTNVHSSANKCGALSLVSRPTRLFINRVSFRNFSNQGGHK